MKSLECLHRVFKHKLYYLDGKFNQRTSDPGQILCCTTVGENVWVIVEQFNHALLNQVESSVGKGQYRKANRWEGALMAKAKILIVDDETSILNLILAYLKPEGYEVYTAPDGLAGLQAARAYKPDLIVLDVMLPGMDGVEVLTRLRRESDVFNDPSVGQ